MLHRNMSVWCACKGSRRMGIVSLGGKNRSKKISCFWNTTDHSFAWYSTIFYVYHSHRCAKVSLHHCISSLNLTIVLSRKKRTERSVTKEQSSQHTTKCCDKSGIWMPWLQIHFRGVNRKSGFCYVRTVLLLGQCDKLQWFKVLYGREQNKGGCFIY